MLDAEGEILTAKSEKTLVDSSVRDKGVFEKTYEPLKTYALQRGERSRRGARRLARRSSDTCVSPRSSGALSQCSYPCQFYNPEHSESLVLYRRPLERARLLGAGAVNVSDF